MIAANKDVSFARNEMDEALLEFGLLLNALVKGELIARTVEDDAIIQASE